MYCRSSEFTDYSLFSVEWWNTLHQGASITKFEKPSIATPMLIPFDFVYFWFYDTLHLVSQCVIAWSY